MYAVGPEYSLVFQFRQQRSQFEHPRNAARSNNKFLHPARSSSQPPACSAMPPAGAGAAPASLEQLKGHDTQGREFSSVGEMWKAELGGAAGGGERPEWYTKGLDYWARVEPSVDGVLGVRALRNRSRPRKLAPRARVRSSCTRRSPSRAAGLPAGVPRRYSRQRRLPGEGGGRGAPARPRAGRRGLRRRHRPHQPEPAAAALR